MKFFDNRWTRSGRGEGGAVPATWVVAGWGNPGLFWKIFVWPQCHACNDTRGWYMLSLMPRETTTVVPGVIQM